MRWDLKTGQTTSYLDTDDGHLQRGISWPTSRFTNNENGTVTDNLTGLIWLRDANCSLFNAPRSWNDVLNIIVPQLANGYCGLIDGSSTGDWRLPNRKELETLLDFEHSNPALPLGHPFINVQSNYYWTSTTFVDNTSNVWIVWMGNGLISNGGNKLNTYYVWPVRGGH